MNFDARGEKFAMHLSYVLRYIDVHVTAEEHGCRKRYANVSLIGRLLPPQFPSCPSEHRPPGSYSTVMAKQIFCLKSTLEKYKFLLAFENSR